MEKKIFQKKVKVIACRKIKEEYFKLVLEDRQIAQGAQPGQFVEIKIQQGLVPFLRRPLGVHRKGKSNFEVLVEIVGKGTQILAQKKPGDDLDVIGPLGRGFSFSPQSLPRRQAGLPRRQAGTVHSPQILVAGGMGVAPLVFLAEKLKGYKVLVLIGARSKAGILCAREFAALGCEVKVATDDGSQGYKGKVTGLLRKILRNRQYAIRPMLYACGPKPMLQETSRIAAQESIPAQISLEAHMACGIGACLGCVVNTRDGFKRVCKEGPVFTAKEIIWE